MFERGDRVGSYQGRRNGSGEQRVSFGIKTQRDSRMAMRVWRRNKKRTGMAGTKVTMAVSFFVRGRSEAERR